MESHGNNVVELQMHYNCRKEEEAEGGAGCCVIVAIVIEMVDYWLVS